MAKKGFMRSKACLISVWLLREGVSRTANKFFAYEYRPREELVLRFRLPKTRTLRSSVRAHSKAAIKEGLLAVRSLFDAVIDFMERREKAEGDSLASNIDASESPVT